MIARVLGPLPPCHGIGPLAGCGFSVPPPLSLPWVGSLISTCAGAVCGCVGLIAACGCVRKIGSYYTTIVSPP